MSIPTETIADPEATITDETNVTPAADETEAKVPFFARGRNVKGLIIKAGVKSGRGAVEEVVK